MEVTGSSVPVRESRSAPSISRLPGLLMRLFAVCGVVGFTLSVYQAWHADQRSTVATSAFDEVFVAEPERVSSTPTPVTQRPDLLSDAKIARAAFETTETSDIDRPVRKTPPRRAAWLTGDIEGIDEPLAPVGKPIPTFDRPLPQPPAIDP